MTLQETISQYLVAAAPYVGTLFLAAFTWLAAHARNWLAAHTKNALVKGILDRLSSEVYNVIQNFEQTAVSVLKAKNGGVLTVDDARAIKAKELAMIKGNLGGDQWITTAQKILGVEDIQTLLESRIEAAVLSRSIQSTLAAARSVD